MVGFWDDVQRFANKYPVQIVLGVLLLIAVNNYYNLQLAEKTGKAVDDFKAWANREPGAFLTLSGIAVYLLFFYKQGQTIGFDWLPFSAVFLGFKTSPNEIEKSHYEMITKGYNIDWAGGGVASIESGTESGLMAINYRRRAEVAGNVKLPSQLLFFYDLKRLPNPPGASRLRAGGDKSMMFTQYSASDLSTVALKIMGFTERDMTSIIIKKVEAGELGEEALYALAGYQRALPKTQGILNQ